MLKNDHGESVMNGLPTAVLKVVIDIITQVNYFRIMRSLDSRLDGKVLFGMFIILIFSTVGFGQINWEIEIVDSLNGYEHLQSLALAVDTLNIPHIVYNTPVYGNSKIIYASRIGGSWQKEVVESGLFYYGFSLIFDSNNIPHLSYCRLDEAINKTYICHAWKEEAGWRIDLVDSITGDFEGWQNWIVYRKTSIALDTSNLPAIAYSSRNIADSITYNKFAHYNGTNWDTSIVEYDSAYANTQERPTDFSPSLDFNSGNIPYIAFQQISIYPHQPYDTLKIAHYNDTLNRWLVEPIFNTIDPWFMVSLKLNKLDYPMIAHNISGCLCFTWWDGASWRTDWIQGIGWYRTKYHLQLDSLENPHILYLPDPLVAHPSYCYKEGNTWHLCGWVEPDPECLTLADISFSFDHNYQPHVAYQFSKSNKLGIKYAKGTFVGVEDELTASARIFLLEISPNPFHDRLRIKLKMGDWKWNPEAISLRIFDASGRPVRQFDHLVSNQFFWDGKKFPPGVYFVHLSTPNGSETRKALLLK